MSYEKELEYLRKEFNKSSAKFHQAEAEGYETDAEIWEDEMVNIGHQIHIHEQAAKADEYEAKAKAYDAIEINIKALRKHMLDSGRSVNAKSIETENTLKHIEEIIEGATYYHD